MRRHRAASAELGYGDQRELHQRRSYDRPGEIAPGKSGPVRGATPGATRVASIGRTVMASCRKFGHLPIQSARSGSGQTLKACRAGLLAPPPLRRTRTPTTRTLHTWRLGLALGCPGLRHSSRRTTAGPLVNQARLADTASPIPATTRSRVDPIANPPATMTSASGRGAKSFSAGHGRVSGRCRRPRMVSRRGDRCGSSVWWRRCGCSRLVGGDRSSGYGELPLSGT